MACAYASRFIRVTMTADYQTSPEPITIRYDGMDASNHHMELGALGDSIKGLSRIIGVAANFAATEKFVQHKDAMSVRVVAAPPRAHCFEILVYLEWVSQNALASTIVGGLTVTLVSYIFSRLARNKAEMKELRGALDLAIKELGSKDQDVVDRLLSTIDKMADALRPAAKLAVAPIGSTATTLTVSSESAHAVSKSVGIADKDAIEAADPAEIVAEQTFRVLLHEMNLDNTSCKVSLPDEPEGRITAIITDPVATTANNPYAAAFAAQRSLSVRAKAAVRDGEIERLYISNTAD